MVRSLRTVISTSLPPGFSGSIGFTGSAGDVGFTGSQGIPGEFAALGYTGSQGATGTSVRIVGSLADQSLLPDPYGGDIGDGYLLEDTGHLWIWDGTAWNDIGRLTGEVGFTGSQGLGIIDTELVNDELIIIYDDSTQNNLGNIRGFQGSRGESTFTWGDTVPENPEVGARWFYTTEGLLLVYTDDGDSQQWVEVSATGFLGQTGFTGSAGLSGVLVQTVTYIAQATAADTQGGETLGIVGGGFNSGITVYVDSTECATTLVDSSNLTFVSPAKSAGTYDIVVHNTDGSTGIKPQGIDYSGAPVWTTQPSLPEQNTDSAISIILSATSNSSVTYFLQQGSSMPAGLSLSSSGVITGTVTGIEEETVYTFTVVAIDAESQTTPRSFSLTITLDLSVNVEYLVIAGGGGGGMTPSTGTGAGGGAGGYRTATEFPLDGSSSITVTVGAGGAGAVYLSTQSVNGTDSHLSAIVSTGGGGGGGDGNSNNAVVGKNGGSGGGGSRNSAAGGLGNTPPTIPSQGNNGGQGSIQYGGGGGGSGGSGEVGSLTANGGAGTASSITGSSVTRAGGGAAGTSGVGTGGGGSTTAGLQNGTANTGGGGSASPGAGTVAGNGGSGVVIIAYPDSQPAITTISAGLTYDQPTRAGYRVYRFTAGTGNITF